MCFANRQRSPPCECWWLFLSPRRLLSPEGLAGSSPGHTGDQRPLSLIQEVLPGWGQCGRTLRGAGGGAADLGTRDP